MVLGADCTRDNRITPFQSEFGEVLFRDLNPPAPLECDSRFANLPHPYHQVTSTRSGRNRSYLRWKQKQLTTPHLRPSHRIRDGVAEHVEEGGLEEGVELGEGLAALGPQGVRRIQNPPQSASARRAAGGGFGGSRTRLRFTCFRSSHRSEGAAPLYQSI